MLISKRIINGQLSPEAIRKRVGLGDAAEFVAKPIAKAADAVLGTNLTNCHPCVGPGGRKERWNKAVPNINPLAK